MRGESDPILRFTVPGPPVPCGRPRVVNGHAFTPPKTEAYEQAAGLCIMQAMTRCRWTLGTRGPFRVELDVYRAAERGDVDNYAKSILDAATRARAWSDDARVTELEVRLFVDRVKPRVEGRIRVEVVRTEGIRSGHAIALDSGLEDYSAGWRPDR